MWDERDDKKEEDEGRDKKGKKWNNRDRKVEVEVVDCINKGREREGGDQGEVERGNRTGRGREREQNRERSKGEKRGRQREGTGQGEVQRGKRRGRERKSEGRGEGG